MWPLLAIVRVSPALQDERRADQRAVERMAAGDHTALGEIYDSHARMIFSIALRILQDRAEAEDVVQEVFTHVWTNAGRYDSARGAVAAWMLVIARSRAIDRLRARRSRPERHDEQAAMGIADPGVPQDLQLLSSEQVRRLQAALQELPTVQRVALEMAYYDGLSHSEIAERLEEPLGTVKTRIRQAVIRLREAITES